MSARPHASAEEPSDAELVARIAAGKLEALGELFERHEPPLRRYLARMGIGASDVDDLIQASFLEVMRAAPRFDPAYSARSWLFGVATQLARRHRRSLARAAERLSAWASALRGQPDARGDGVQQRENEAALRSIARAFERLSEEKREVFALVSMEGWSGDEAARALGIPLKTVWTRLHHARHALRAALPEEDR